MLSMLVCVSAVFVNAPLNFPPFILSNSPAGIVVRLEQSYQAASKSVPADVSISGKLVRLVQPRQVWLKLVPDEVSIKGKLVRLLQPLQAKRNSVPDEVSIRGKLVNSDQFFQKPLKVVTAP